MCKEMARGWLSLGNRLRDESHLQRTSPIVLIPSPPSSSKKAIESRPYRSSRKRFMCAAPRLPEHSSSKPSARTMSRLGVHPGWSRSVSRAEKRPVRLFLSVFFFTNPESQLTLCEENRRMARYHAPSEAPRPQSHCPSKWALKGGYFQVEASAMGTTSWCAVSIRGFRLASVPLRV